MSEIAIACSSFRIEEQGKSKLNFAGWSDRQRLEKIIPRIEELYNSSEYGITGFADGVVLMEKGVASNLDAVDGWKNFRQLLSGSYLGFSPFIIL
ncbi:hypothetical protein [Okeania sp. SIO2C9]|uniref:hypothetical protein n=1 Tax=Okeania sp. SIO2C9 TaxID=2607791 RepID=UPI0025F07F95|nr:hypothetical protein [Okeania sp. SIO2C9]